MNPVIQEETSSALGTGQDRWKLVIFNNAVTAFEDVIETLMSATGCDAEEAYLEAWEAHHLGEAAVHFEVEKEVLEPMARQLATIGVRSDISKEFS